MVGNICSGLSNRTEGTGVSVTNRNSMPGGAETGFTCRSQRSQVIRCPHKYCFVAALAPSLQAARLQSFARPPAPTGEAGA